MDAPPRPGSRAPHRIRRTARPRRGARSRRASDHAVSVTSGSGAPGPRETCSARSRRRRTVAVRLLDPGSGKGWMGVHASAEERRACVVHERQEIRLAPPSAPVAARHKTLPGREAADGRGRKAHVRGDVAVLPNPGDGVTDAERGVLPLHRDQRLGGVDRQAPRLPAVAPPFREERVEAAGPVEAHPVAHGLLADAGAARARNHVIPRRPLAQAGRGLVTDRDVNAARNILRRGMAMAGWEIGSSSGPGASESVPGSDVAGLPGQDAERCTGDHDGHSFI